MLAAGAAYKTAQLGGYSYERMEQIQLQTARLQQVFRGMGGSARELADDVLKLAAAEGRGTEEAMQAAVQWSRLGLTRRQVAEATRVSMVAANVAELSTEETTLRLSAVMSAYGLQVSDLHTVLGSLNDLTNRYRITAKDLLDALARVSGTAHQAGMNLTELQGVITSMVSQTGRPGGEVGNSIRTILSRVNRSDVKDFFALQFGTNLTGKAQDLQTIWSIYSKVNDEQQRDITLKVAGVNQANRFRAMMAGYAQAIRASTDALVHLDSATQEDILISNSAAAARQRLISSYDRFVNSPSVSGYAANMMNTGAGILAGFTGGPSNAIGATRYHDASQATKLGAWAGIGNTISLGMGRQFGQTAWGVGAYLKDLWNWRGGNFWSSYSRGMGEYDKRYWQGLGFFADPQTQGDIFGQQTRFINERRSSAEAYGMRGRFWQTVAAGWKDFTPSAKAGVLDSLEGTVSADTLARLRRGDTSGLSREAQESLDRQQRDTAAAQKLTQRDIKYWEGEASKTTDLAKKAEIQSKINELLRVEAAQNDEIAEQIKNEIAEYERMSRVLAEQKGLMEDIGATFKGLGLSRSIEEALSLQAQLAATQAMANAATGDEQKALNKKAIDLESQLSYRQSVQGRYYAGVESDRGIAATMAGAQFHAAGIGLSEGERLIAQRNYAAAQLRLHGDPSKLTNPNDQIRALSLINQLKNVELSISQRLLANEQERKQVMLETQREFQKSLITAGPGEILRKLAVAQLSRRGMNAGSFFAMGSEARGDAYTLMGGERMAALNAEARAMRGQVLNVPQLQQMARGADEWSERTGAAYANSVAAGAAKACADAMATLGGKSMGLANRFDMLADKMDRLATRVDSVLGSSMPTAPTARPPAQMSMNMHPNGRPIPEMYR